MSAIIETPPFARTIHSLSLVEPHGHKSIRVPCRTPENGLEALEMKGIFEDLDQHLERIKASEEQWRVVQDILERYDIAGFGDRITHLEGEMADHAIEIEQASISNKTQDSDIALLKQKIAILEAFADNFQVDTSGVSERVKALEDLTSKHTQDIANLVTDLRVTNGDQDVRTWELKNFVDIFYANQTSYNDHLLSRINAMGG